MLHADLQAILGEDDVLLAHALRDVAAHLVNAEVDLVGDPGEGGENEDGEDEGEKLSLGDDFTLLVMLILGLEAGVFGGRGS